MEKHHPDNERIKRAYFAWMRNAKGSSEASVDAAAAAIHRFESHARFRDFKGLHTEQAIAFKRHLRDQANGVTGEPLSASTIYSILSALKAFFKWLAGQPGYRSRISYSDADYFSADRAITAIAKAQREPMVATLEQICHVSNTMPAGTVIERRDRAVVAFAILTGARDRAIASMKLRHVDLIEGRVYQDARQVRTKFGKTFTTTFFPVGDVFETILFDWIKHLRTVELWGLDDPLFPKTLVEIEKSGQFTAVGLERAHWSTAAPIRKIFRRAFEAAGLPYHNPHSFRHTLVQLGQQLCQSPEEFKAWSQNLGHESPLTTFTSYGQVPFGRQAEVIRRLAGRVREQRSLASDADPPFRR
jgi:integrase